MKTVKERDTEDLLELTVQLSGRMAMQPSNKIMFDAYWEARNELDLRIAYYLKIAAELSPSSSIPEITDNEIDRKLTFISDAQANERRNWGKGQIVGLPPTSKEHNKYLDGFENGAKWYRSELKRREGKEGKNG